MRILSLGMNKNCWITFKKFSTNFETFIIDIEQANGCTFDFLLLSGSTSEERFCGTSFIDEMISFRGPVEIEFLSDASVQEEGFQLFFFVETDTEGSGGGPIPDPGKNL